MRIAVCQWKLLLRNQGILNRKNHQNTMEKELDSLKLLISLSAFQILHFRA